MIIYDKSTEMRNIMADPIITSTNTGNRRNNMAMSSQQAAARNNPGQINRSVGQMSSHGVARSGMNQIHQGDVIRGEISDLRNNEITITLENNTLIKGQIADSSSLSYWTDSCFPSLLHFAFREFFWMPYQTAIPRQN